MQHRPLDLGLKLVAIAGSNYLFKCAYEENRTVAYIAVAVSVLAYSWIVYHNYQITIKLGA
jgi:hypothetical protein